MFDKLISAKRCVRFESFSKFKCNNTCQAVVFASGLLSVLGLMFFLLGEFFKDPI